MKYLKLFEGYLDRYYTEIPEDEFYEIFRSGIDSSHELVDIGLDYFERLKSYETDMNIRYNLLRPDVQCHYIYPAAAKTVKGILIDSSVKFRSQGERLREIEKRPYLGYYFEIYGFSDEWFLVKFEDCCSIEVVYYKCDQMEGLIRLLKDKNVIE
jgi:hypothetical protein